MKITRLDMPEDFTCHCGNHSHNVGFYTCGKDGKYKDDDDGWLGHWRCERCGDVYLDAALDTTACGKAFGASKATSAPGTPLTVYHGTGREGPDKAADLAVPAFFYVERAGADWIAEDRTGKVLTANLVALAPLDLRQPEGLNALLDLAATAGVAFERKTMPGGAWMFACEAIRVRFGQAGDDPLHLVLFPEVQQALQAAGYDSVVADEPLENDCVTTWVVFKQEQILPAFPDWN